MVEMWNLHCQADLDVILWSDPLKTFVSFLSERVQPIYCFRELWEFVYVFFSPRTINNLPHLAHS